MLNSGEWGRMFSMNALSSYHQYSSNRHGTACLQWQQCFLGLNVATPFPKFENSFMGPIDRKTPQDLIQTHKHITHTQIRSRAHMRAHTVSSFTGYCFCFSLLCVQLFSVNNYLPTISISPDTNIVWKEGASADTSQLNLPDMFSPTDVNNTWLAFDCERCNKQIHTIHIILYVQ